MAGRLNVNPTRMEMSKLKRRLLVARRGYKLLKDKRDELMKKFMELAARNKVLREEAEEELLHFHEGFQHLQSVMQPEMLEEALLFPKQVIAVHTSLKNIMSVNVPEFTLEETDIGGDGIHPYGYAFTTSRMDEWVEQMARILPKMLLLAQVEKSVQLLSLEIEKTRRRVNALEHVLIPQLEETIKFISMKLEENERGNLTRLMKVKDMMLERRLSG